jgi:DNA-binding beta-propeller fold protein YncE
VLPGLAAALAVILSLWCVDAALANDTIYWSNYSNTISYASLDGGGGGDLDTPYATMGRPLGTAIDAAAGRIYWSNSFTGGISFAALDGSGGADLDLGSATSVKPIGVAIDRSQDRVYWADSQEDTISFANLDGSGGGDLFTGAATVSRPAGVAVDPAAARIYWANNTANKISFANLTAAGGGGDIATGGATVEAPAGVAIDRALGRIYWANAVGDKISFANLDGSGGGDLDTGGASVEAPEGVAIDPALGRIYWANGANNTISFAALDGSGGADLDTGAATSFEPSFPSLLEAPAGAGVPTIEGGSSAGSVLACSQGSWEPDVAASFLYRAPDSLEYQWSLDGADIPGATAATQTTTAAGSYRCRVTASNHAGATTQTSAPFAVTATSVTPSQGAAAPGVARQPPAAELKLVVKPRILHLAPGRTGRFKVTVSNGAGGGAAAGIRVCVKLSQRTRRYLHASRCASVGAVGAGATRRATLRVRAKSTAHGVYRLSFAVAGAAAAAVRAKLAVTESGQ